MAYIQIAEWKLVLLLVETAVFGHATSQIVGATGRTEVGVATIFGALICSLIILGTPRAERVVRRYASGG